MLGYADAIRTRDDPCTTRLRQANSVARQPLSMEDGEAGSNPPRLPKSDLDRATVMGWQAGVISDRDYRVTDVPPRGAWSYYARKAWRRTRRLSVR
jgi:hypothetical protein